MEACIIANIIPVGSFYKPGMQDPIPIMWVPTSYIYIITHLVTIVQGGPSPPSHAQLTVARLSLGLGDIQQGMM